MTAVKRADLQRRLAAFDQSIRLILFSGPDESASRALALEALAVAGDPSDPMALTDLTGDELKADPARLADEAASVSMFGGRRVIRVTGAADTVAEAVRLLLAAPVAGNPVVMLAGDLAKTSTLRKLAEDSPQALALHSYALTGPELDRWLQAEARAIGLRLEGGVADRLISATGGDSGVLASELGKFALFLDATPASPKALDRSHLQALGADSAEEDLSLLVNAVIAGNAPALERQLRLLEGGSAILALRALSRRLLQMAEARAAVDSGQQPQAAVRALRPPVFWKDVDAVAAALRHWPMPRIRQALSALMAGEQAIKTPRGPGDTAGWQAIARIALAARLGMGRESA
jgi:DNA polymerase III subunit delta